MEGVAFHRKRTGGKYSIELLQAASCLLLDGLKIQDVATKLGISYHTVGHLCNGTLEGGALTMANEIDRRTREKLWYTQYKR